MILRNIKIKLDNSPDLKRKVLNWIMHPTKARPRLWLRLLQFFYINKGKGSIIYRSVRKDIVPFNKFIIGYNSVIEDYSVINNAVGDIIIGNNSRIGIANTIIGPISIGNSVNLGQNIVLSGLNHNYKDVTEIIATQGVSRELIRIEDDVWVGANTVVLAGVTIGTHSCIGAGSVVTKDIPSYSVAAGNPARVIKKYDSQVKEWVRI